MIPAFSPVSRSRRDLRFHGTPCSGAPAAARWVFTTSQREGVNIGVNFPVMFPVIFPAMFPMPAQVGCEVALWRAAQV